MKKLSFVFALMLVFGLAFAVADGGVSVTGSVGFSFGDDDVATAPGPTFSSSESAAVASLAASMANDQVKAGLTLSLLPTITETDAVSREDITDTTDSHFDALVKMHDWYEANKADLGGTAIDWVTLIGNTTLSDAVAAGDDSGDITWTAALVSDSQAAAVAANTAIIARINAISGLPTGFNVAASGGAVVNAYDTAAEKKAEADALDFYSDYQDYALGATADATWSASFPISSAYLQLLKVGGVADVTFEVNGKAVSVGSMVTSANSAGDANLGVLLGLSDGVVSGVTAKVLVTASEGAAAVSLADGSTDATDVAAAEEPTWGTEAWVGYATDMFGVKVMAGATDLTDAANTLLFSVMPSVTMANLYGLSLSGEFNYLGADKAMGAGAALSASVMGVTPKVSFYWKDANYYGDDTINVDGTDSIDDTSLMTEFNSTDLDAATALDIALSADLEKLMGMKLVTLSGGYQMMLTGSKNYGWNAGVALDLASVVNMPVTAGFTISQYAANDMTWTAKLGYTYAKSFVVSAALTQVDADTMSYTVGGKVSF